MPQVLKEEVEARIRAAALERFARAGYERASMAAIARGAGISTGNVYRYFRGKAELFRAVVPEKDARELMRLLRERVESARGAPSPEGLSADGPYARAAEATLDFALEHRHQVVLLLGRASGTRYERLAEEVVEMLVGAVIEHVRELQGSIEVSAALQFDLEQIYRNYVDAWVRILERFEDPAEARTAIGAYERYHLGGLRRLFE
jgi:AcrR family transcriptional regulator